MWFPFCIVHSKCRWVTVFHQSVSKKDSQSLTQSWIQSPVLWTTYETLAVAANVNIEEVLKLAPDRPPNTTTVTKGGKTGNLFAQSVCWDQMTRKIKSANKVETSTKGCYFALCVFFSLLFCVSQSPMFPGKHSKGVVGLVLMKKLILRVLNSFLHYT